MLANSVVVERTTARRDRRLAVASSFTGSAIEFYDFLLYGAVAGLVFPKVFFTGMTPTLALLLSYLTLFTGYLGRPIGGLLFGHFGDRVGRKKILFLTLMVMGLVSIGIGFMPTRAQIGLAAPVLLTVLRLVQGIAVGGEWAGAMLMSLEHSGERSKGFSSALSIAGAPAGGVMSTLVLGAFAGLSPHAFLTWGWRIPFFFSVLLVVFGVFLRSRITESPEFEAAQREGRINVHDLPIKTMVTTYRREIVVGVLSVVGPLFVQGLMSTFVVPYVVARHVMPAREALLWLTMSSVLHVVTIPFFAWLSDRLGRKKVMIGAAAFSAVMLWPFFALLNSHNPTMVILAFIIGNPLIQASMYGPIGAFLSELFDTPSRYTGVSASYQIGAVLGGGLAPIVATTLITPAHGTTFLAWYGVGAFIISALAVLLARPYATRKQTHVDRFEEAMRIEG